MPTVLVRAAEPTQMAFRRALPITGRPSGLLKKPAGPQRCLFGVPNHHESIRVARAEIEVEQRRLSCKYNFDFENDAPLPGKFQYEKIDQSTEAVERRLHEVLTAVAGKENTEKTADLDKSGSTQKPLTGMYLDFFFHIYLGLLFYPFSVALSKGPIEWEWVYLLIKVEPTSRGQFLWVLPLSSIVGFFSLVMIVLVVS